MGIILTPPARTSVRPVLSKYLLGASAQLRGVTAINSAVHRDTQGFMLSPRKVVASLRPPRSRVRSAFSRITAGAAGQAFKASGLRMLLGVPAAKLTMFLKAASKYKS